MCYSITVAAAPSPAHHPRATIRKSEKLNAERFEFIVEVGFFTGNLVAMLWIEFIRGRTIRYIFVFSRSGFCVFFFFGSRNSIERISCIFPTRKNPRSISIFEFPKKKRAKKEIAQLWRALGVWTRTRGRSGYSQRKRADGKWKKWKSGGDDGGNGVAWHGSHRSKCEFSIFKTLRIMHLPAGPALAPTSF